MRMSRRRVGAARHDKVHAGRLHALLGSIVRFRRSLAIEGALHLLTEAQDAFRLAILPRDFETNADGALDVFARTIRASVA